MQAARAAFGAVLAVTKNVTVLIFDLFWPQGPEGGSAQRCGVRGGACPASALS